MIMESRWQKEITYVNNEEYLFDAEMNVAHWGLNKRAKNELEITVPDSLVANLSIAVTDRGIDADTSENIISGLLLSGEIRGRINNPAYYFRNNSDSVLKNLDLVMLTHGWRKINWEKLSRNEMPEIKYPKDSGYLSFSGRIFGASPIQLRDAGSIVVLFNSKGNPNNIVNMPISPDGTFGDPNLILFDTTKVYYQLPKSKGLGDASVKFMQDRFPPLANTEKATGYFYNPLADTSGNHRHFLLADAAINDQRFSKAKTLETVTIKKREKSAVEVLDEKYASGMFSGADGYQFDVLNDPFSTASMNIFNYLQGKVPGLQVNTTSNPPTLVWRGGAPGIYLNEMPTDADMISTIPVSDVAYIKVLRPPFLGASGGGNGAIAIYTRKGGDVQQQPGKGLSNNTITGYTAIRQFYAPDYSTIQEGQDKRDLRTTLYWNPEIITEPGKNVFKLTFYNNDISEAFRVTIQGMTRDGRLTSVVKIME